MSETEKETGESGIGLQPFKIDTWCGTALSVVWTRPHNEPACVSVSMCACVWA